MKAEVLWHNDSKRDFLQDSKSFAMSLDFYQITFNVEKPDEKKYVQIKDGKYEHLIRAKARSVQMPCL